MPRQGINIGTPNGNDGEFVRDAFDKTNDNFTEIYDITPKTGNSTTDPNTDVNAAELVTEYPNTPLYWVVTGGVTPVRYMYDFTTSTWIVDEDNIINQDNIVRIIDVGIVSASSDTEAAKQTAVNAAFDALSASIRTKADNENIIVIADVTVDDES